VGRGKTGEPKGPARADKKKVQKKLAIIFGNLIIGMAFLGGLEKAPTFWFPSSTPLLLTTARTSPIHNRRNIRYPVSGGCEL
jgi:hypothetical protein